MLGWDPRLLEAVSLHSVSQHSCWSPKGQLESVSCSHSPLQEGLETVEKDSVKKKSPPKKVFLFMNSESAEWDLEINLHIIGSFQSEDQGAFSVCTLEDTSLRTLLGS